MSREFASFMASITGDAVEQKIQELMEILDKVMQITINTSESLYGQIAQLETDIHQTLTKIVNLESRPIPTAAPGGAPIPMSGNGIAAPLSAPAPPPPQPKPMSPVSARAALQGELKELFAKRKR
ncbi:MAG: hypothetical protein EU536_04855 [Promethearchaeota archaeon]|nr:MAG: hypothetical protein EU536_04855 [Candidatus Lokiarchaeota archaeon]